VAAEQVAQAVDLPQQSFQSLRRRIRNALDASGVAARGDQLVADLLAAVPTA